MAAAEQGATTKWPHIAYGVPEMLRRLGVVTLGLALLGGCGGGTFPPDGGSGGVTPVYVPGTPGGEKPSSLEPPAVPFPAELVGTWNGDDAGGQGSWFIQFAPDGRYRMQNQRRGVAIDRHGQVCVVLAEVLGRPPGPCSPAVLEPSEYGGCLDSAQRRDS